MRTERRRPHIGIYFDINLLATEMDTDLFCPFFPWLPRFSFFPLGNEGRTHAISVVEKLKDHSEDVLDIVSWPSRGLAHHGRRWSLDGCKATIYFDMTGTWESRLCGEHEGHEEHFCSFERAIADMYSISPESTLHVDSLHHSQCAYWIHWILYFDGTYQEGLESPGQWLISQGIAACSAHLERGQGLTAR